MKNRHPEPLDERGILSARTLSASGPGGARILVYGSSDRRYTVSATSPGLLSFHEKRPDVLVTPGLGKAHVWVSLAQRIVRGQIRGWRGKARALGTFLYRTGA